MRSIIHTKSINRKKFNLINLPNSDNLIELYHTIGGEDTVTSCEQDSVASSAMPGAVNRDESR